MDLKLQTRSAWIKEQARLLGFQDCGISKAVYLDEEAKQLTQWLQTDKHGKMAYMENHFDMRVDPRQLVPGAESVIVLTMNYFPQKTQIEGSPKLSKYAYGKDYHKVIRKRLKRFLAILTDQFGEIQGRGFVDSAPVMEKAWAKRSGIGWVGKHSNIISKKTGSFFFLAVLITDLPLAYDQPVTDHCGTCTKCIDACPTDALDVPYQLDASKCISYFTIELKDEKIPSALKGKFNEWMFGCDICQDVCPWNRFSRPHQTNEFEPKEGLLNMTKDEWLTLSQDQFDSIFEASAVKRTKYQGLIRNIKFLYEY